MRSGTGTKSRPPSSVVRATKSRIDCFAGPSFQDGSGSTWAKAGTHVAPAMAASPVIITRRFMIASLLPH